ncbi:MAG: peptidylprolyl isomerase, partial [Arenibacter algicola]|nr:peptidylprolyl isomerase [Arenibacter algicola]
MNKVIKTGFSLSILLLTGIMSAQECENLPDTQVEPQEVIVEESMISKNDSVNNFKRIKLDGIAAVVGDYV